MVVQAVVSRAVTFVPTPAGPAEWDYVQVVKYDESKKTIRCNRKPAPSAAVRPTGRTRLVDSNACPLIASLDDLRWTLNCSEGRPEGGTTPGDRSFLDAAQLANVSILSMSDVSMNFVHALPRTVHDRAPLNHFLRVIGLANARAPR
jgi:hypothetical protein